MTRNAMWLTLTLLYYLQALNSGIKEAIYANKANTESNLAVESNKSRDTSKQKKFLNSSKMIKPYSTVNSQKDLSYYNNLCAGTSKMEHILKL